MCTAKFEKCRCGTSVLVLTLHCHGDSPLMGQEGSEESKEHGYFRPTEEVGNACKQSHQSGMQVHLLDGSLLPTSTPTLQSRGPPGTGDCIATQQGILRGQASGTEPLPPPGMSPSHPSVAVSEHQAGETEATGPSLLVKQQIRRRRIKNS